MKPNTIAAALYAVLAVFCVAVWTSLATDGTARWALSSQNENRLWFFGLAAYTVAACGLAAIFFAGRSTSRPRATILVTIAGAFFALTVWQCDVELCWCPGAAFAYALVGWRRASNPAFQRTATRPLN